MAGRVAYYGNIVKDGLVLDLDAAKRDSYPTTGTVWSDISGTGYSSNLINGPVFSTSGSGALGFDGTSSYITGSSSPIFAFGTGNFTTSVWFNLSVNTSGTILDFRLSGAGSGPGYSDYINGSSKFLLYWNSANRYTTTATISANTWYNVVATRASTTLSVYINGTLDGTATDSTNLTEGSFRLARNTNITGTTYMNGKIGQVCVYNRALSSTEVLQNYNATKGRYGL